MLGVGIFAMIATLAFPDAATATRVPEAGRGTVTTVSDDIAVLIGAFRVIFTSFLR